MSENSRRILNDIENGRSKRSTSRPSILPQTKWPFSGATEISPWNWTFTTSVTLTVTWSLFSSRSEVQTVMTYNYTVVIDNGNSYDITKCYFFNLTRWTWRLKLTKVCKFAVVLVVNRGWPWFMQRFIHFRLPRILNIQLFSIRFYKVFCPIYISYVPLPVLVPRP